MSKENDDKIWHKILDGLECKIISYDPTPEELKQMLLDMKYCFKYGLVDKSCGFHVESLKDIFISPEAMEDIKNWSKNE